MILHPLTHTHQIIFVYSTHMTICPQTGVARWNLWPFLYRENQIEFLCPHKKLMLSVLKLLDSQKCEWVVQSLISLQLIYFSCSNHFGSNSTQTQSPWKRSRKRSRGSARPKSCVQAVMANGVDHFVSDAYKNHRHHLLSHH